jgi:hypothetical protein
MYELKKKIGKVFTSKFVRTGPSSYEKRIYRAAVSHRLRSGALDFVVNITRYLSALVHTNNNFPIPELYFHTLNH